MSRNRTYYVYIMANEQRTIYVGMTNNLERPVWEHKHPEKDTCSFTKRHRLTKLVYIEDYANPSDAIAREKALKGWTRSRKVELINGQNPDWIDLAREWFAQAGTMNVARTNRFG